MATYELSNDDYEQMVANETDLYAIGLEIADDQNDATDTKFRPLSEDGDVAGLVDKHGCNSLKTVVDDENYLANLNMFHNGSREQANDHRVVTMASTSFYTMLKGVEENARKESLERKKIMAEIQRVLPVFQQRSAEQECLDPSEHHPFERHPSEHRPSKQNADNSHLWTEKYRPKKFIDLVSIDKAHREILRWAIEWRNKIDPSYGGPSQRGLGQKDQLFSREGIPPLILLSGSPGVGKTSLAHIVANVAGFAVVEVNASDERGGEVVVSKIKAALQNNSMKGERRPNLVIIDEIDGAFEGSEGRGLVGFLHALIQGRKAEQQDEGASKKPKAPPQLVAKRPIICICNDLYSPALRILRTSSTCPIMTIRRPSSACIAKRLKEILVKEKKPVLENKVLLELADTMDGDLRSCLHALQFSSRWHDQSHDLAIDGKLCSILKSLAVYDERLVGLDGKVKKLLLMEDDCQKEPGSENGGLKRLVENYQRESKSLPIGSSMMLNNNQKDQQKTTMTLYKEIFLNRGKRIDQLATDIYNHGEIKEQLLSGVFELYLGSRFYDDTRLGKVNSALETFSFLDITCGNHGFEGREQYASFALARMNLFFGSAVDTGVNKFPREDAVRSLTKNKMLELIQQYRSAPSVITGCGSVDELVMYRMPTVRKLIRPDQLKLSNYQLMKADERQKLHRIVQIMVSEGLSFKFIEGSLRLMPDIEAICGLEKGEGSLKGAVKSQLEQNTCQLIGSEVAKAKIAAAHHREGMMDNMVGQGQVGAKESAPLKTNNRSAELTQAYASMSERAKKIDLTISTSNAAKRDFFGRPIVRSADDDASGDATALLMAKQTDKKRMWFKYNEGFTNAVRRNIKIKEFLFID